MRSNLRDPLREWRKECNACDLGWVQEVLRRTFSLCWVRTELPVVFGAQPNYLLTGVRTSTHIRTDREQVALTPTTLAIRRFCFLSHQINIVGKTLPIHVLSHHLPPLSLIDHIWTLLLLAPRSPYGCQTQLATFDLNLSQPKPSLLHFPEISNDFILSLSALHLVTILFYSLSDLSVICTSFSENLWTTKQESFLKFLIKTLKTTTKTVLFLNEAFSPFSQNGIT